jgi:hypothetical protein
MLKTSKELEGGTDALKMMTHVDLKVVVSWQDKNVRSMVFPGAGAVPSALDIWQYWLDKGQDWTAERFQGSYNRRKAIMAERPEATSAAKSPFYQMEKLGIGALPFYMDKIAHGETEYIPLAADLTHAFERDAKAAAVLQWWQENKDRWLVPWGGKPNPLSSGAMPTSAPSSRPAVGRPRQHPDSRTVNDSGVSLLDASLRSTRSSRYCGCCQAGGFLSL